MIFISLRASIIIAVFVISDSSRAGQRLHDVLPPACETFLSRVFFNKLHLQTDNFVGLELNKKHIIRCLLLF